MSVAIAVVGIVNTLSLSIHERRHEIGLLRAVGMTPRQVKVMIRLESVILAVLGTLTGVLGGLFAGGTMIRAIEGASLEAPWGELALVVVVGIAVGFLASLWPTRRASQVGVLDALRTT